MVCKVVLVVSLSDSSSQNRYFKFNCGLLRNSWDEVVKVITNDYIFFKIQLHFVLNISSSETTLFER